MRAALPVAILVHQVRLDRRLMHGARRRPPFLIGEPGRQQGSQDQEPDFRLAGHVILLLPAACEGMRIPEFAACSTIPLRARRAGTGC
jgi:hypothetical protein